jgi:hypothetical protein
LNPHITEKTPKGEIEKKTQKITTTTTTTKQQTTTPPLQKNKIKHQIKSHIT